MISIDSTKINGDRTEIEIPMVRTIFNSIRNTNGAKFDFERKRWSIPNSSIEELSQKLNPYCKINDYKINMDEPTSKRQKCEKNEIRVKLRYDTVNGYAKLIDYSTDVFNLFKSLPNRYYDSNTKEWVFNVNLMDEVTYGLNNLNVIIQ